MKKILLLLVTMLATTTVWATDFITDVMVIGGSKSEVNSLKTTYTNQGWTVIDQDLNAGCGSSSDYIYLLYKTASDGTSGATFITNFLISTSEGTAPNSFMDNGRVYYLVAYDGSTYFKNNKGDLNSHCGSGSATIHLYYTKDYADDLGTVKSIYFNDTQEGGVSVDGSTTGYDLNAGCGSSSDYIYMHAEKSQGWTYTKNASGTQCYINGYDGPKANITSITIPTTLDGAQVANFTGSVFSGFTNLETMIFNENTIVSQMPSVNGLTKFKNVKTSNSLGNNNTPPSMTSIPASTFEGTAVMVINLTSVNSIGNYAFKGCGNLKDVYVNSTLNNIGKQVFYNCSSLAHFWFNGTETQWNAVSKDSQWRNGAPNFTEHWRCTVTFDANGHGTAPAAQTLWSNYDKVTTPTAPTANGCIFQGWYTEAECINQWDFNTVVLGDITLYAKWNAKYTYNSATGALTLNWGEFNKENKWGSDVPASAVTSVTATSQVSFTGDCSELFKDFKNCTSMDLDSVNTSNATNMSSMFSGCNFLSTLNISNWDTGNVTNMSRMFSGCSCLTSLNVSNWNTSNVTDMSFMFQSCHSITTIDLSNWDIGKAFNMWNMFYGCDNLTTANLSGWDLSSNSVSISNLFSLCSNLKTVNLTGWKLGATNQIFCMFQNCRQLTTIYASTSWDASYINAPSTTKMFEGCTSLVGGMGTTFDENYTDKTYARIDRGATEPGYFTGVFTLSLPGDVTASPEPICTFGGADYYAAGSTVTLTYNGEVPEGKIVVFSVNGNPIEGRTFEMPLNDINITVTVTDPPRYTFNSETGELTLLWGEFNSGNKWGSDVPASAVTSVTATSEVSFTGNCAELFRYFSNCTSMDLGNVNTSTVTNMAAMFNSCPKLETLNVVGWNTGNVTTTNAMFYGCSSLNSIDVSGWNTGKLSNMSGMFYGCSSLTSLDLSGWTTSSVTTMAALFLNCSNLTTIYVVEDWDLGHLYDSDGMFYGCTSLVGGKGTTYDQNHINSEYARIDGGPNRPGYFTDKNSVVVVTGDVDGDGYVTSVDITAIYNYLLNGDMTYFDTSDVDGDGYITTTDITVIYNILLGN